MTESIHKKTQEEEEVAIRGLLRACRNWWDLKTQDNIKELKLAIMACDGIPHEEPE